MQNTAAQHRTVQLWTLLNTLLLLREAAAIARCTLNARSPYSTSSFSPRSHGNSSSVTLFLSTTTASPHGSHGRSRLSGSCSLNMARNNPSRKLTSGQSWPPPRYPNSPNTSSSDSLFTSRFFSSFTRWLASSAYLQSDGTLSFAAMVIPLSRR